jgi:hypothetical protein
MKMYKFTYHCVNGRYLDVGPYRIQAESLDRAIALAMPMIERDYPGINLGRDYHLHPTFTIEEPNT